MSTNTQLEACPLTLSEEQIQSFRRDGFLAFRDVLTPGELAEARGALTTLVHHMADGSREQVGRFWVKPGSRFGIQFEGEASEGATPEELELQVRKFMWYADEHPHLGFLARDHPKISALLTALLGPAPILFQDMALVKPPFIGSEKPWHQDNAYFSVEPLQAVCGVWIALDDATAENGCMHVLRGCHHEACKHIHDRDCEIPVRNLPIENAEAIEIPAGGALFFAGMLPHQTPRNTSPERRRALQFHYRAADSRILPREAYDALYRAYDGMTGESVPASCANGWKE